MRKLVLILIAFIAVITFIKAYDNSNGINSDETYSNGINYEETRTGKIAPLVLK